MYLRHTTVRKHGKTHTYWRLVRSVRTGRGVKQVSVCQLGELDEEGRLAARQLAGRLVGVERQPGLFDDPAPGEPIALDLSQLQLERGRRFGDVWLAWKLWQALQLDDLLARVIPAGEEDVPWPVIAAILAVARLCAPSSELSLAENWFRKTALGDLLGVPEEKINDDRLYRALVSEEHLEWLRGRGSRYIVGTPKSRLKKFEQSLIDGAWHEIREGLQVQKVRADETEEQSQPETFILCRSADRAAKERAMRERFAQRIEQGLGQLQERCRRSKPGKLGTGAVERIVGRLMGWNTRAASFFDVRVTQDAVGRTQLNWKRCEVPLALAELRDGCYLLRTNVADWTPEELWRAYIHLTDVEAAFRTQKDELGLRPIWHRLGDRIESHILVCFPGDALQKTLEGWCEKAGLGRSPRKVLDELAQIHSTDETFPTSDGRTVRLRCIVRPDPAQNTLLTRLGLDLPKRLRLPAGVARPARPAAAPPPM